MLERETQQRQAVQAQLTQEQAKCALLEQEILQASQAAHEMGESLRQYFSQTGSVCSDATTATMQAWAAALTGSACPSAEPSLAGDTPRAANIGHHASTAAKQHVPASTQQSMRHDTNLACDQALMSTTATAPGQLPQHHSSKRSSSRLGTDQHQKAPPSLLQQHLQQRRAMQTPLEHQIPHSSCSPGHGALRCSSQLSAATDFSPLVSKQPKVGRGSTARMQRHVLQVADQLQGLAISWQQRLDNCELPPCTSPTKPAMITISAAVAAASGGRGATQALRQAPAGKAAAAAAAAGRPAGHSEDWGSNSCQSSATAMCAYDASASCDLSSSTSSFVRYRSNQAAYGESPADIEEGDEEGDEGWSEGQREDGSDGYVCCETDEEAEAAQLRWHVQQLEQQQQQQAQQRPLPSHSHLQQHAQQQVLAKHAQWQQQQQVGLGSWARPAHYTVAPGCAITRGAASRAAPPATDSSSTAMQQATSAAASGAASGASAARSPLAAGAPGGNIVKSLPPAPHMMPQQQEQQRNMHGYTPASGPWQQQQQHSSSFPSLSGTSCSGTPAVQQQQHSLRGGAAAGTGVEHIPQELKFMAPLRRHQQYLGTT
jgi:hypothetical protein